MLKRILFYTLIFTSLCQAFTLKDETDYLIISPTEFLDLADSLATYRSNSSIDDVVSPAIIDVNDIYESYKDSVAGVANPKAMSIRHFLRNTIRTYSNLKYVVLLGKGYIEDSVRNDKNFIPVITDNFILSSNEHRISDDLYISEKYGVNNIYPISISVGRLSIKNNEQFFNIFSKIKKFENSSGNWKSRILFAADDDKNYASNDPVEKQTPDYICHEDQIETYLTSTIPSHYIQQKTYMQMFPLAADNYQRPQATIDLLSKINSENLFVTFVGHGFQHGWSYEEFLRHPHLNELKNENPYIQLSLTCLNGDLTTTERDSSSLSESLNTMKYGSVVSIASSNLALGLKNILFGQQIFRNLYIDSTSKSIGSLVIKAKNYDQSTDTYAPFISSYILFGDPATTIHTSAFTQMLGDTISDTVTTSTNESYELAIYGLNDSITYSRNSRVEELQTFSCKLWGNTFLDTVFTSEIDLSTISLDSGYYNISIATINSHTPEIQNFDSVYISYKKVNVNSQFNNEKFLIYPNPIQKQFFIRVKEFNNSDEFKIRLTHLNGQFIKEFFIFDENSTHNRYNIDNGTYIAEILSNNKVIFKKLIFFTK